MVAHSNNIQIAKRLHKHQQQQMAQAAHSAQFTLNAILWQMIISQQNTVEAPEDENEESIFEPVMLTLPISDLQKIPGNFGLTLRQNKDDTISVIAILTKPKSNIILPGGGTG